MTDEKPDFVRCSVDGCDGMNTRNFMIRVDGKWQCRYHPTITEEPPEEEEPKEQPYRCPGLPR